MKARLHLLALVSVLAMVMTVPAGATSHITLNSFSNSPTGDGDPVTTVTDATTTVNYDWLIIDMGGGIDVVEDTDPAAPNNGDQVGVVDLTARFSAFFCFNNNYDFGIYWVSPVSNNGPSGTVAEMRIAAPTGDIPAYVVEDGSGDDSIHVDMTGTDTCTSNPTAEMTVTTWKRVDNRNNGAVVARNGAPGNYTLTTSIKIGSTTHSDSAPYSVT